MPVRCAVGLRSVDKRLDCCGSGANTVYLKVLFDSQLAVLELALIFGVSGLIRKTDSQKRRLSHLAAILIIVGTLLVSLGAALPIS